MFRHQGKDRTVKHNMQIAIVLSFVAGIVNAAGFLAIRQLTTNVTGHFALFISDLSDFQFWKGTIYFLYILSFLLGAFASGLLIELFRENRKLNVYVLPTIIESVLLMAVALLSNVEGLLHQDMIACLLLFAMGLQNSFVTKISDAVVRTTHLTGLFTDLGIELSQLFFPNSHPDREHLKSTIRLRIYIITFFFAGGLVGGLFYSRFGFGLNTLLLAVAVLIGSLFFDDLRFRFTSQKRKLDGGKS
ncbi:MAG: DUF1275 domain-containing protein [Flavobacteriales bacterium]|nr:DUF1275 domain-containing protein [Flavobacteriales bacterium]